MGLPQLLLEVAHITRTKAKRVSSSFGFCCAKHLPLTHRSRCGYRRMQSILVRACWPVGQPYSVASSWSPTGASVHLFFSVFIWYQRRGLNHECLFFWCFYPSTRGEAIPDGPKAKSWKARTFSFEDSRNFLKSENDALFFIVPSRIQSAHD